MKATNHILVDDEVKEFINKKKLINDESNNSALRRILNLSPIIFNKKGGKKNGKDNCKKSS
ncbi:MAG: hypothetical protein KKF56_05305 [Nanoarchaeota archaeon]|nr:hypothetical protein [Nanoarchaeota archaeon]